MLEGPIRCSTVLPALYKSAIGSEKQSLEPGFGEPMAKESSASRSTAFIAWRPPAGVMAAVPLLTSSMTGISSKEFMSGWSFLLVSILSPSSANGQVWMPVLVIGSRMGPTSSFA